jgi:FHS family L-fucose permease-like MFS transporter
MGPEENATQRLNMAQAFNPIGSLLGMYVAMNFIQNRLDPLDTAQRAQLTAEQFEAVKNHDLSVVVAPYLIIGLIILAMLIVIRCIKMPKSSDENNRSINFVPTLKRLFTLRRYREGVITQFFYVGAQIMCWTFIIQYGTRVFMAEGMSEQAAEVLSQRYNIIAMVIFCVSRFACTYMLKFVNPGRLLGILAVCAALLTCGVIFLQDVNGLYCLVGVSACMSLMFPTIYGIALNGLGDDAKFGAAGLIMAILGGSILPPLQASIIDMGTIGSMPAVNVSFVMPLISFIVVTIYGFRTMHAK